MEDQNEEGRGPNFAPQNPNAILNPPMGGVPQNPLPNPAHGLGGDNMEGGSIHGGTFMDKQPHEAYSYFDYLANLTRDWASTGTQNPEVGSEELKEVSCAVCETKEHDTISCPVIPGIKEALHGQVNAIGHYGQGARNPYSNTYNPGSLEDTLQQFIQSQGGVNSRVDKTLDDIKSQLTLLTQALTLTEKGKLPAQPQPNPSRHVHSAEISNQPSSSHEQVQAITVLRSGKTIDKTILPIDPKGRGEASKVVDSTVGGDRETGEKKESEVSVERGGEKRKDWVST
ncbi:hypothetical protein Acr_10g0009370 [Actinidia rufa]|uniref:Uncharacterized protein n=1 Tax=Actinidia rufa TaxID=165716 RepID=A0A7J0FA28_9ERIC|nr:hypothetical protein Acr_10g0009370 [Actinidia rufa]